VRVLERKQCAVMDLLAAISRLCRFCDASSDNREAKIGNKVSVEHSERVHTIGFKYQVPRDMMDTDRSAGMDTYERRWKVLGCCKHLPMVSFVFLDRAGDSSFDVEMYIVLMGIVVASLERWSSLYRQ
jgi:hypothetical protein